MAIKDVLDFEGLSHFTEKMKSFVTAITSKLETNKLDKTTVATSSILGLVKSGTDITVDTSGNVSVKDNSHKHTVSNISDLTATASELNYVDGVTSNIQTQLNAKAPLASPTLTGTPKAPTATAGTNTTQIATTAFVQTAVSNLVDSAPETLNTLNELSSALGDDPNFATTVATQLGNKVDKVNGKGLSTNDYTTAEKNKLAGIASGANAYSHPTSSGNKHIPSGGSSGQILRWSADGTAVWGNDNNTTYSNFVKSGSGAKAGLVPAPSTTAGTTKYLREDGTWAVPPDTNTTYTSLKNPYALTIQGNGTTLTNGTYDGSAAKTVNITPSSIGAATSGHTHSSYVNQNAFSNVTVGSTTISADTTTDTLTLASGSNVTITPDATNDKITISSSHPTISKSTNTTSTASPSAGGTFTAIDSITQDSNGHVTKFNTKTVTLPSTSITVDSALSSTSTNPVQNKVIYSNIAYNTNGKALYEDYDYENGMVGQYVGSGYSFPPATNTRFENLITQCIKGDMQKAKKTSVLSSVSECTASTTATDIAGASALAELNNSLTTKQECGGYNTIENISDFSYTVKEDGVYIITLSGTALTDQGMMHLKKNGVQCSPMCDVIRTYQILQCTIVEKLSIGDVITAWSQYVGSQTARRIYYSVVKL